MAEEEKKTKKAPAKKAAPKKAEVKEEAAPETAPVTDKKAAKKAVKEAKKAEKASKKAAKEEIPSKPPVTEARCISRDVRVTPRKVRLVADLVRGKSVSDALGILARTNRAASTPVAKAIRSAAANATNNFGLNKDTLYVAEIQVSDGLRIKRFIPRGKGSASPIIKRNANLTVVVKERN